jgi:glycosyltransferase involved in cell wall biosynthesis
MSIYNEPKEWLMQSIESILKQSYKNLEFIIIVDNPDNQDAVDIVKEYAKRDKRVKFFINEKNRGLIYSLNRALSYAKGEYIARMDADDISRNDRFEKQIFYLIENDLDLVGSNVNLFKGDREVFFTTDKLLTHKYIEKILIAGTIGIVHPTFFAKREVFKKLEGYVNAPHAEDKEFLSRLFCHGFRVGNLKEVLLECRYSPNSVTKNNAAYVNMVGSYITECFRACQKSKEYFFDENRISSIMVSQEQKDRFNKKRILLDKAREALSEKRYIHFFVQISKALFYSRTLFDNLRINVLLKYYRVRENFEQRYIQS